ncbi:MAG: hypothetical protein ACI9DC_004241 [Gammaproteobacteria bacterium]|jgi:hypothetical protein
MPESGEWGKQMNGEMTVSEAVTRRRSNRAFASAAAPDRAELEQALSVASRAINYSQLAPALLTSNGSVTTCISPLLALHQSGVKSLLCHSGDHEDPLKIDSACADVTEPCEDVYVLRITILMRGPSLSVQHVRAVTYLLIDDERPSFR